MNLKLKIKYSEMHDLTAPNRLLTLFSFTDTYNSFFLTAARDIFYFSKKIKTKRKSIMYYIFMSFRPSRLYINIHNFFKKNYMGFSTGLFIKFFEKKKAMKKSKALKILMAKFLRKLILILNLKNLILMVKKTPVFLLEMLNFLNQPISHKFQNPVNNEIVSETIETRPMFIKFLYFIFTKNHSFTINKTRQKGRVKRKIYRKLVLINQVVD